MVTYSLVFYVLQESSEAVLICSEGESCPLRTSPKANYMIPNPSTSRIQDPDTLPFFIPPRRAFNKNRVHLKPHTRTTWQNTRLRVVDHAEWASACLGLSYLRRGDLHINQNGSLPVPRKNYHYDNILTNTIYL